MACPAAVAQMLSWEEYHGQWPDIPASELRASSVHLRIGETDERKEVLLHKRRVSDAQASGDEAVLTCDDCFAAFSHAKPFMCKYALANHMWLGRWDPLFRDANLSHQMLLALARVVTTKVVLRPEGRLVTKGSSHSSWDLCSTNRA